MSIISTRRSLNSVASLLLFLCLRASASIAQSAQTPSTPDVPRTISYQAAVTNASGTPLADGDYTIGAALYSENGAHAIWHDSYRAHVQRGVVNLALGSGEIPLPDLSRLGALSLGIRINGSEELPLSQFTAAPYALTVPNGAITSNKLADNAVTSDKIGTDYVSSLSINGQKISGKAADINLITGDGITAALDPASNSILLNSVSNGIRAAKGADGQSNLSVFGTLTVTSSTFLNTTGGTTTISSLTASKPVKTDASQVLVSGAIDLASSNDVTGTLPITHGGTGATTASGAATNLLPSQSGFGGKFLSTDGSGTLSWAAAGGSSAWGLTGNTGTFSFTNYIGTNDNQAFEIHVNQGGGAFTGTHRVMRYEPNATSANIIGGFQTNHVSLGVVGATIAGGGEGTDNNGVTGSYGTVGGGIGNNAAGFATVAGGEVNTASGTTATVAGGSNNTATNSYSTVGGGNSNEASGFAATVAGGSGNTAGGDNSVVLGGNSNSANGTASAVLGGMGLELDAARSFGFLANAASQNMRVRVPNTAFFGNVDLWLANNDGTSHELRFYAAHGNTAFDYPFADSYYVGFKSPDVLANSTMYALPIADGTAGEVLVTDGSEQLGWSSSVGNAVNFTGNLAGDVTGTQSNTEVLTVGTSSAANIHSAEVAANEATSADIATRIVKRGNDGSIYAGYISGSSFEAGNNGTSTPGFVVIDDGASHTGTIQFNGPAALSHTYWLPGNDGTLALLSDIPSGNFIKNTTTLQTGSNFNIDGTGIINGNALVGGNLGVGEFNPLAAVHVNGAILAEGTSEPTPTSGAGQRMMWVPSKAAFRAGTVTSSQWDDGNIGQNSVAFGVNTIANGANSAAFGFDNQAAGQYSFVAGSHSYAGGSGSVALGTNATSNNTPGSFVFSDNSGTSTLTDASNQFMIRASGGYKLFDDGSGNPLLEMSAGHVAITGNLVVTDASANSVTITNSHGSTGTYALPNTAASGTLALLSDITSNLANGTANGNILEWNGTAWGPSATMTNADGSFLINGGAGVASVSGPGTRMMWVPSKAAFRAGTATGTEWDNTNLGQNSVAFGTHAVAEGANASAFGHDARANGDNTFAAGSSVSAGGSGSIALGSNGSTNSFVGCFMFGDNSGANTSTDAANQFMARASGGFKFFDDATAFPTVTISGGGNISAEGNINAGDIFANHISSSSVIIGNAVDFATINNVSGSDGTYELPNFPATGTLALRSDISAALPNGTTNGNMLEWSGTAWHASPTMTNANGAFLISGTSGTTPTTGSGTRMMWVPSKAAFRAGQVIGTEWNDANIGQYSVAFGLEPIASGSVSMALGDEATASGDVSLAVGDIVTASGDHSYALGTSTSTDGRAFSLAYGDGSAQTTNDAAHQFMARASGGFKLFDDNSSDPALELQAGSLTVEGTQDVGTSISVSNSNGGSSSEASFDVYGSAGMGVFRIGIVPLTVASPFSGDNFIIAENRPIHIATGQAMPIKFATNDIERMRLDENGNLGIGTASPGTMLDVNGSVHVASTITMDGHVLATSHATTASSNSGVTITDVPVFIISDGGTTANFAITMPGSPASGDVIIVINHDSAHDATYTSGATLIGTVPHTGSRTFYYDGTSWE